MTQGLVAHCADVPDESDDRYFAALRERGLFALAERICLRRLQAAELSSEQRTAAILELSRTYAAHARHARSVSESDELWQQARAAARDGLAANPTHPAAIWLRAQELFVSCEEREAAEMRAELLPFDARWTQRIRELLSVVIPQLTMLEQDVIANSRRLRGANIVRDSNLNDSGRLLKLIQLRLAENLVAGGRIAGADSADRADAWQQAEARLRQLAGGSREEGVTWSAQLAWARLLRERGDSERLQSLLAAMERDAPPAAVRDAIVAERAELLLRERQFVEAVELLRNYRREHAVAGGRIGFLMGATLVELARMAHERGDEKLGSDLFEQAQRLVDEGREIGDSHWSARASQRIQRAQDELRFGARLAALLDEARGRHAAQDSEGAMTALENAYAETVRTNRADDRLDVGFTLARLLVELGHYARATSVLASMLADDPPRDRVAELHVLMAYCLGRSYQQAPSRETRDAYLAALTTHIHQFPNSPTASDAAWMLAQLQEQLGEYQQALRHYVKIPAGHQHADAARSGTARCFAALIAQQRSGNVKDYDWESEAVQRLGPAAADVADASAAPLSGPQVEFVLHTAWILITSRQPDWQRLDQLVSALERALPLEKSPHRDELSEETAALRLLWHLRQGRLPHAQSSVKTLAMQPPRLAIDLATRLEQQTAHLPAQERKVIAEFGVELLQTVRSHHADTTAAEELAIDRGLAAGFERLARNADAIAAYERVLRATPDDATLVKKLAELHGGAADVDWHSAKTRWRSVEANSKPGSVEWLRARAEIIRACLRLQQRSEADKLLRVTKLLYPELGNDETRVLFRELEDELKRASP